MERHTGIPMGHPYSTVLISPPIMRLSSLSRPLSHSLTGSLPEAVLKNRAGSIFSESFMPMLYHIWYNMSSVKLHCKKAGMPYLGFAAGRNRKSEEETGQVGYREQTSSGSWEQRRVLPFAKKSAALSKFSRRGT